VRAIFDQVDVFESTRTIRNEIDKSLVALQEGALR